MKDQLQILLVEDNPADAELVSDLLAQSRYRLQLSSATDGEEALEFLRRQGKYSNAASPDLVMLDLNLPRKDGRAVLREVRADGNLRRLPIVVFTTSQAQHDIQRSYELGANCYVSKPGNLPDFIAAIRTIEQFWFGMARLPE